MGRGHSQNTANLGVVGGFRTTIAFSPDGKALALADGDNTIDLMDVAGHRAIDVLDAATGTRKVVLQRQSETRYSLVAFSPDGKTLASCGLRRVHDQNATAMISLWELATGKIITNFSTTGPQYLFSALAFSPDGKTLVSGRANGEVLVWDVASGRNTATLEGHASWVRCLVFSPDGKRIASRSQDDTIRLWDAVTDKDRAVLNAGISYTFDYFPSSWSLVFSPDGKTLASASSCSSVRFWDLSLAEDNYEKSKEPTRHPR